MRLCSTGCGSKIPDGTRYCEDCQSSRLPQPDGEHIHIGANGSYDEQIDKLRKSGRWQRLRLLVVQAKPWCVLCDTALAEIVDHIVPAWVVIQQARQSGLYQLDPWAGYFLRSNLQGLCRPCHGAKTKRDKAHDGAWPNAIAKEQNAPKKVWSF